ncbi:hypothetical protein EUX98_g4220 [Antrodiella citrinella]|uniref:Uncharacterized protein n=1 Tax=Antrodiella citrinella TaxID=2447956 RepID=A0A4S4MUI5_9APHY|nr:hypothetical protein EUX98_g4220 [Antrodiella citrinella]
MLPNELRELFLEDAFNDPWSDPSSNGEEGSVCDEADDDDDSGEVLYGEDDREDVL